MPLKIIKNPDGTRTVVCKPKKVKIGSRVPPRIKMADEVPYEMEKVQRGLLHNPQRFKLVR